MCYRFLTNCRQYREKIMKKELILASSLIAILAGSATEAKATDPENCVGKVQGMLTTIQDPMHIQWCMCHGTLYNINYYTYVCTNIGEVIWTAPMISATNCKAACDGTYYPPGSTTRTPACS